MRRRILLLLLLVGTDAKPQFNSGDFYSNSYQSQIGVNPPSGFGVNNFGAFSRPYYTGSFLRSFSPYGSSYGGSGGFHEGDEPPLNDYTQPSGHYDFASGGYGSIGNGGPMGSTMGAGGGGQWSSGLIGGGYPSNCYGSNCLPPHSDFGGGQPPMNPQGSPPPLGNGLGGEDYNSGEEDDPYGDEIEQSNLRRYAEYLNLVNRRYGIGMPGQSTAMGPINVGNNGIPNPPMENANPQSLHSPMPSGMGSILSRYSPSPQPFMGYGGGYGSYGSNNVYDQQYQWNMGYGSNNGDPYAQSGPSDYLGGWGGVPSPNPYGYAGLSYPMQNTQYPNTNTMTTQSPMSPEVSKEKSSMENSGTTSQEKTAAPSPPSATSIKALTQQIRRLPAVLYVDSRDLDGRRVENMLRDTYGLPLVSFYVDKIDRPKVVERYLQQLTAHKGMPYLFICGTFIGRAALRQREDAHIRAALNFAVHWLNAHRPEWGHFGLRIRGIHVADHYGLITNVCQMIEKDRIFAFFAPADNPLSLQLNRLTDSLDLPLFTVVDDFSLGADNRWKSKIELFPREHLHEALSDLIRHWHWTRVIVVYSEVERVVRLIPFLEKELYSSIRFHFVHIQNGDFFAAAHEIKRVKECPDIQQQECSQFSRILVDMSPLDTHQFLLVALQMGFIDVKHWFLLTSLDLRHMDMNLYRHNHARFIAVDPTSPEFLRTEVDFNFAEFRRQIESNWTFENENSKELRMSEAILAFDGVLLAAHALHNISQYYPLKTDYHTTHCRTPTRGYIPYRYGKKLIDQIKNSSLTGLTGDLGRIGKPITIAGNFSFRINLLGYTGRIDDIGYWEPITDVHVNMTHDSKAQLQNNVKVSDELKPHFRVSTIMERPYVMLKKNHFELDQNAQFEGFCIDLLHELSNDLGFTYTISVVKDNKYGSDIYGNGSWDGMIGEILRGEADMVVAPFTANFRRAEVVDFTKPFLSLGISILYKIPADHQPDLFSFLNPLSLEIWVLIVASICGLTLGMYLCAQITPYEWNLNFSCCTAHQPHPAATYTSEDSSIQLSNNYSFWNTLWYVMSTMLKGGCDFGPRAMSTRMLGGTWWMFTLVIVSAYTANLAAVLTVSKPHIPIRSLDDLANQTKILYGTIKGGSTMQFFQESRIPSHTKMWNYMKKHDVFVGSNREGVQKVLTGDYAYLMESTSLEYEVQQNCNLTQIGGVLGSKGYGIALEKKSEWTDRISRQILLYQKRGIIEMKKTKWWRSKGAACHGMGSSVKQQRVSLNLYNVSGLFLILFSGLLFSAITVMIEFLWQSRNVGKSGIKTELRCALNRQNVRDHKSRKVKRKAPEDSEKDA